MLSYQLGGCIASEGQVGTLSPPRRSRAVSLHPVIELSRKVRAVLAGGILFPALCRHRKGLKPKNPTKLKIWWLLFRRSLNPQLR